MTTLKNRFIKSIRDKIPAGYIVGRERGEGKAQLISLHDFMRKTRRVQGVVNSGDIANGSIGTVQLAANAATGHILSEDSSSRPVNVVTAGSYATTGIITTIAMTAPSTITSTGPNFVTLGFVAGDTIHVLNSTVGNQNSGTYTIASVTATVITINETTLTTLAAGNNIDIRGTETPAYNAGTATVVHSLGSVSVQSTGDFVHFEFSVRLQTSNFWVTHGADYVYVSIYDTSTSTTLYQETLRSIVVINSVNRVYSDGVFNVPAILDFATGLSVGAHNIELRMQLVDMHTASAVGKPTLGTVTFSAGKATVYKR